MHVVYCSNKEILRFKTLQSIQEVVELGKNDELGLKTKNFAYSRHDM